MLPEVGAAGNSPALGLCVDFTHATAGDSTCGRGASGQGRMQWTLAGFCSEIRCPPLVSAPQRLVAKACEHSLEIGREW
jgi:hypothetical protein